jgi:hypothetical protein
MLLARELLGVCVTILAQDPESTFAQGPVLEILRTSLDWCQVDMKIGPENAGAGLINKSAWQAHYD